MCSRGLLPAEINHPSLFSNLGNTFIYTWRKKHKKKRKEKWLAGEKKPWSSTWTWSWENRAGEHLHLSEVACLSNRCPSCYQLYRTCPSNLFHGAHTRIPKTQVLLTPKLTNYLINPTTDSVCWLICFCKIFYFF
jgi:hypothetical protein